MPDFACMMLWRCRQLGSQKFSCALTFHLHRSLVSGGRAGTCWNSPIFKEPNITIVPSCQTVQIPILPRASLGRTKDQHTVTIACHLPSCCHHAVRIWAQALKGQSAHLHKYQSFCTNQPLALVLISVLKALNVSQNFACDDLVFKLWRERSKMTHIWGLTRFLEFPFLGLISLRKTIYSWILLDPFGVTRSRLRSFHHGDMVSVEHGWAMKFDSIFISTFLRCSIHS